MNISLGGYEPDICDDVATDFDLWLEEMREKASKMSLQELYSERLEAVLDKDETLAEIYEAEISKRDPIINIPPCSTLADEPWCQDDPEHEDRWDEYKENYMAEAEGYVEPDELPF